MKRLLLFLAGIFLFSSLPIFFFLQNDRFALSVIAPLEPIEKISAQPPDLSSIIHQKFYYLGKGSQCFAFISEDQKVVLKFFRNSRFRIPTWLRAQGLPEYSKVIWKKKVEEKKEKRIRLHESCMLAFEKIPQACGLIHLQLLPSHSSLAKVTLVDKLHRSHLIELGEYEFLIQKKAIPLSTYFDELASQGKIGEMKKKMEEVILLLRLTDEKGIHNDDSYITKNMGFVDDHPMFIDIGSFSLRKDESFNSHFREINRLLLRWPLLRD